MNERGPDAVAEALDKLAVEQREHAATLDRAATMIRRMAATIALIKAATNKGRTE